MNWTDRLSEYLDGELDSEAAAAIEVELRRDPTLRGLLDELRLVKVAAADQPDAPAPEIIWEGLRQRIAPERAAVAFVEPGRRRSPGLRSKLMFTVPQFAAAAGVLLLLGVSVGRMSNGPHVEVPVAAVPLEQPAVPNYASFVADLEARLDAGRATLQPETARVIEESLLKIDSAIAQARTALDNDPNNTYLNQHLASARARKLRLLEDATALIASTT